MTKMDKPSAFSRRTLLKGAGALVVSVGTTVGLDMMLATREAFAQGARQGNVAVTSIGTVIAGTAIPAFLDARGRELMLTRRSFSHF